MFYPFFFNHGLIARQQLFSANEFLAQAGGQKSEIG
jgi:hypothetical protein